MKFISPLKEIKNEILYRVFNELIENKSPILDLKETGIKNPISFIEKLSSMINKYYEIDFDNDFEYYFVDYKIVKENKIKLTLERVTVMYSYG